MDQKKGHCKHGEFILGEGCERCMIEARLERARSVKQIVKIRYYSETTGKLSAREYTYYSVDRLKVGDVVWVPIRDTTGKARVTAIDVPESEIQAFKDKVKTIPAGSIVKLRIDPELTKISARFIDEANIERLNAHLEAEIEFSKNSIEGQARQSTADAAGQTRVATTGEPWLKQEGNSTAGEVVREEEEAVVVPQAFPTAVVRIEPGKDLKVQQLLGEIMRIKEWADKLVVASEDDAKLATSDLSIMGKLKKAVEEKRQEYVGPLNAHVDAVNGAFKLLTGPLAQADKTARDKVTAYKVEQDRRRQEAEEVNRQAIELARKQAALNHGEFTVDVTPVKIPEAPRLTRTEVGTSGLVKTRKYRVVDFAKLPDQYKIENSLLLNKVVRAGIPEIPGVEIYIEESLRITPQ